MWIFNGSEVHDSPTSTIVTSSYNSSTGGTSKLTIGGGPPLVEIQRTYFCIASNTIEKASVAFLVQIEDIKTANQTLIFRIESEIISKCDLCIQ